MKKILGILLAALMLLTLLPVAAMADGEVPEKVEYYNTYINHKSVLASETDVFGDGSVVYTPATGKSSAKLTLKWADFTGITDGDQQDAPQEARIAGLVENVEKVEGQGEIVPVPRPVLISNATICAYENLEIELQGTNYVPSIYVADGYDLTISGTGSLTVDPKGPDYPIYVGRNLTIEDAVSVKATSDGDDEAIYAGYNVVINTSGTVTADATFYGNGHESAIRANYGSVTIKGDSTVKAYSDPGDAIYACEDIIIAGNANVTAECDGTYAAICAQKDLTISTRGTVTADARGESDGSIPGSGKGSSDAILAQYGDVVITAGTVKAYASRGYAIYAGYDFSIMGTANVIAKCDGCDKAAICSAGDLTISTLGTVTADATDDRDSGASAIYAYDELVISSGTVKATANKTMAIYVNGSLTIKGTANVEAANYAGSSTIWVNQDITINTVGSVKATNSGNASAMGCYGTLQIDNAGKLLLCGNGTLYLSNKNALDLAKGLTFYGSVEKTTNEKSIIGETQYKVAGAGSYYSLWVNNGETSQLAQTVLLKGKDSTPLTRLADLIKAATSTFNMVQHLTNVAKLVSGGAAGLVLAARTLSTLSRIFFHF